MSLPTLSAEKTKKSFEEVVIFYGGDAL
jgi:hypothetical protein